MRSRLAFISAGSLLLISLLLAEGGDLYAAEEGRVCFSVETAARIDAELQRADALREQIELYKQANEELEQQVRILREIAALQKQQAEASRAAVDSMKTVVKDQAEAYERVVKEARPSFFKQLRDAAGFIGLGILAGVLLL